MPTRWMPRVVRKNWLDRLCRSPALGFLMFLPDQMLFYRAPLETGAFRTVISGIHPYITLDYRTTTSALRHT